MEEFKYRRFEQDPECIMVCECEVCEEKSGEKYFEDGQECGVVAIWIADEVDRETPKHLCDDCHAVLERVHVVIPGIDSEKVLVAVIGELKFALEAREGKIAIPMLEEFNELLSMFIEKEEIDVDEKLRC